MADDEILEFIKNKKQYVEDDYKFRIFFDFIFLERCGTIYEKQDESLSKKLETCQQKPENMKKFLNTNPTKQFTRNGIVVYGMSSYSGFLPPEKFIYNVEAANANREVKEKNFLGAFEKLIVDKSLIPDHCVLILNKDKHHIGRFKRKLSTPLSSAKKLKCATGTKLITEYFKVIKSNSDRTAPSKQEFFKYKVEEIIYKLRGEDDVKLLWIPEKHSELDPISYISILLKSETCHFLENNKNETPRSALQHNFDVLPDIVFSRVNSRITIYEEQYLERNGDIEFDQDEGDEDD